MNERAYYYGTGRRKTAVARVRLFPGEGSLVINGRPFDEVFSEETFDYIILCSVLEHVKYPNLAAVKLLKCLK